MIQKNQKKFIYQILDDELQKNEIPKEVFEKCKETV